MWIIRTALKSPYAVAVTALLILVMGVVAIKGIAVDILPVFKAPAVQVMTYFSGMPTAAVEKTITNRIERWTNQATGCQRVESKSTLGVSVVRLYFQDNIDPNGALTQVNSLALGTLPTLPPNTLPPVVVPFDPTATIPLGTLTVSGSSKSGMDETALKDLARIEIRNMLGGVKGVVAPAVFGGKDRTILIYVNPRALQARGLSPMDVVDALSRQNFMNTPGVAKFGGYEFQLTSNAMVGSVNELNQIPIRTDPGNRVYLSDVGYAKDSSAIQTSLVRINGRRQVYIPIYRQQGASTLTVIDGVKAAIPRMTSILKSEGKDVKLDLVMDQSLYVREAIRSLIHEGVIGALLVSAMILIFLGNGRMTLIAVLSIPLAILCSLIGLFATGNTINAMTLGGLALAIGPLVDNAIVVLENTHRHHTLGKSPVAAAFDGAAEVTIPVLVATLATIIVLCPIALMPGMGGFLFRPLTLAVAFAMIASFTLSQTLVPALCAKWLRGDIHPGAEHQSTGWGKRIHGRIESVIQWTTRRYERLLALAMRRRKAVLIGVSLLFCCSLLLLLGIGREFFPQIDAGQITLYLRTPSGTNLEAAERRVVERRAIPQRPNPRHRPEDDHLRTRLGARLVRRVYGEFRNARQHDQGSTQRRANQKRSGIRHPAPPCFRENPQVQRFAGQLRHGRHGLRRAELRRLVADRRADRGGQFDRGPRAGPANSRSCDRHSRRRRRPHPAAALRPAADHRRRSEKSRRRRPRHASGDEPSDHGDEFQCVDQTQFLDRPQVG